jgi:hypothetical protein
MLGWFVIYRAESASERESKRTSQVSHILTKNNSRTSSNILRCPPTHLPTHPPTRLRLATRLRPLESEAKCAVMSASDTSK